MIGIILIPSLMASTLELFQKPIDVLLGQHLAAVVRDVGRRLAQAAFALACLPYEAVFSLDAIVRTVGTDADHAQAASRMESIERIGSQRPHGPRRLVPVDVDRPGDRHWRDAGFWCCRSPAVLVVAGPILILWLVSPAIAWWISRPLARREARLTADQTFFLRKLSRKTWAFFETFVGPEDQLAAAG